MNSSFRRQHYHRPLLAYWFDAEPNFGDLATPFLIRHFTGIEPINLLGTHRGLNPLHHNFLKRETYVSLGQRLGFTHHPEYLVTGSILGWRVWKPDVQVIWGAGFMTETTTLHHPPNRLVAVRGERSLAQIPREWQRDMQALGDPGVLVGDLVKDKVREPDGRIGIIPHYRDKDAPVLAAIAQDPRYRLINIQQDVEPFVRQLASCSIVLASALHAIIAADGLGIPNRWIRLAEGPLPPGGHFKFEDYFSVAGNPQHEPDLVSKASDVTDSAKHALERDVGPMKRALMGCVPFGMTAA